MVAHVASGAWRLPSFATNGDTRLFHKLRAVHQLTMRLSACEVLRAVGEDPEEEMSVDADEALRGLVELKAGPDGGEVSENSTRRLP